MKLLRYGDSGRERPGMLDAGGRIRDLSSVVPDIAGATLLPESLARLLVSYISQFMSLQPGDVISTGTPPGVGLWPEAASVPEAGSDHASGHRRPRRAAPDNRGRLAI